MDFTREPIIETVISAKEGHKLLVRSSKMSGSEEYNVDAVEVVSFGSVQFFRGQEKPRPFLVPVTDYEVLEVREMRLPIKSANHERGIKIAPKNEGGKKSKTKERSEEKAEEEPAEQGEAKKKRTRRRTRRKKGEESEAPESDQVVEPSKEKAEETPPLRKPLVPPPTTLISETISRYKDILMGESEGKIEPPALPKELQEEVKSD